MKGNSIFTHGKIKKIQSISKFLEQGLVMKHTHVHTHTPYALWCLNFDYFSAGKSNLHSYENTALSSKEPVGLLRGGGRKDRPAGDSAI